jgi:signal-transduction protein with cAMP-binding, CBS, and nucleotidyltransferase domain
MTKDKFTRVSEVMTPSPRVIDGLATVREAVELMRRNSISSLVIDRRHDGDEYGLVVVSDIADKVIARGRSVARTNVYEIMSKPVLTLDAGMDIKYALRLLGRFGLSRALVTDDGNLVGIVTMRDMVLRYLSDSGDDEM